MSIDALAARTVGWAIITIFASIPIFSTIIGATLHRLQVPSIKSTWASFDSLSHSLPKTLHLSDCDIIFQILTVIFVRRLFRFVRSCITCTSLVAFAIAAWLSWNYVKKARKRCRLNKHFRYQETASVNEPFVVADASTTTAIVVVVAAAHDNRVCVCLFNAFILHQLTVFIFVWLCHLPSTYTANSVQRGTQWMRRHKTRWRWHGICDHRFYIRRRRRRCTCACLPACLLFVLVALYSLQKDKQHNKNGKSDFVIHRHRGGWVFSARYIHIRVCHNE